MRGQIEAFRNCAQLLADLAEDFFTRAQRLLKYADAQQAAFVDVGIHRAGGDEVVDDHHFAFLSVTVYTPDALFDPHRVPRQIVIDHAIAELEIQSFAADFGGEQNIQCVGLFLALGKALADVAAVFVRYAAVDHTDTDACRK